MNLLIKVLLVSICAYTVSCLPQFDILSNEPTLNDLQKLFEHTESGLTTQSEKTAANTLKEIPTEVKDDSQDRKETELSRSKRQLAVPLGFRSYDYGDYYGGLTGDYNYDYYDWVCSETRCRVCNILGGECCDPATGPNCVLPDSCLNNPCLAGGSCVTTTTLLGNPDFLCICLPGLTGKYCQITNDYIVDGFLPNIPIGPAFPPHGPFPPPGPFPGPFPGPAQGFGQGYQQYQPQGPQMPSYAPPPPSQQPQYQPQAPAPPSYAPPPPSQEAQYQPQAPAQQPQYQPQAPPPSFSPYQQQPQFQQPQYQLQAPAQQPQYQPQLPPALVPYQQPQIQRPQVQQQQYAPAAPSQQQYSQLQSFEQQFYQQQQQVPPFPAVQQQQQQYSQPQVFQQLSYQQQQQDQVPPIPDDQKQPSSQQSVTSQDQQIPVQPSVLTSRQSSFAVQESSQETSSVRNLDTSNELSVPDSTLSTETAVQDQDSLVQPTNKIPVQQSILSTKPSINSAVSNSTDISLQNNIVTRPQLSKVKFQPAGMKPLSSRIRRINCGSGRAWNAELNECVDFALARHKNS